ncbi:MAG: hypothetical protein M3384_22165 [Acidobacteriota bacterium]|nr:hypothetical protein [Acidobacteriota bacterium]
MAETLKDENKLKLFFIMAFNLLFYYAVVKNDAIRGGDWATLARGAADILPAGAGLILSGIINALLSSDTKARIIFTRWKDPLPGCRAFSKYGPKDHRVNMQNLESKHGPLPNDPREQNVVWYRLYRTLQNEAEIKSIHRLFLFARDYACIALLMLIILGTVGFFQIPSIKTAWFYFAILLIQFLIALIAARNLGVRFVTTVLALKGVDNNG